MAEPAIEVETASAYVEHRTLELVSRHDPRSMGRRHFLGAWFDAGLMWVHFPKGLGGLGVQRGLQASADVVLHDTGGMHSFALNPIGYGMAAPRSWSMRDPSSHMNCCVRSLAAITSGASSLARRGRAQQ
jgi:hypothetical protein